ncbi:bacterial Ig-like domain-containing protein [Halalkalibacter alkalisediminis]|uniref:Bacterial Ig-like domain-containing protein n=1 Tax=Halalkalibacter alkalisediminis TaxID=935616 RepID=A0ABV6NIX5_9BACI|nr:bacterial Ig-like domain-containing protein [Halalkalibacter alkalisediminis]
MRRKHHRFVAMIMAIILVLTPMNLAVLAETGENELDREMIQISSDWRGSVFGDNGGQGNINYDNYEITEHDNDTVTVRSSNDKGKISSSTEGIAYYFKDVPSDGNFELTATAHVDAWTANNQVSFGLMLRGNVLENVNQGTFTGDYVAVGALDQQMKGFYKHASSGIQKDGLGFEAIAPAADQEYELSIQKSGNLYMLKINDEVRLIENYDGEINFAGLYTSRNTTVTFSDVNIKIDDGKIDLGDWNFNAFGSNTSSERNPEPTLNDDGSVKLVATGGKVAAADEGISFYYKELSVAANFEIKTKASVNSFNSNGTISTPNQKSFGLMIRDEIGEHGDSITQTTEYVAVGALDTVMKGFYKQGGTQSKFEPFTDLNVPAAGEEYDLTIRKSGNTFVVTANGQSETVTLDDLFTDEIYVGFYVARDADVIYSEFEINVDARQVTGLDVNTSNMKTEYLRGESLDLTGLVVTAQYSDGSQSVLSSNDFIVTGFDSSEVGTNTVTINYNGVTKSIDLEIKALSVTGLDIKYFPAKTVYYKGDSFDPLGFTVVAEYENGYKFEELKNSQYSFIISGEELTDEGYVFESAGTVEVTVRSTETPDTTTTFDVVVTDAEMEKLEIRQAPVKTLYFLGDELDLAGLSLYALYSNGSGVRLLAGDYEVSKLETTTTGERKVTFTHKGVSTNFAVWVKERELEAIKVTNYPQTTFVTDENFNSTGLVVSKVYDNLDKEVLPESEYTVDSSAFNSSKAGTYDIVIAPTDESIDSIVYSVSVREDVETEWKTMRFGQSSSDQRNYVEMLDDGSVKVVALEGGGKITGDHDGIAFYYTEIDAEEDNFVLSANIKVLEYAKTPHDGQESFGIMARDAVNSVQDASVFASNIAAIGGFSGGTREENGTQAFVRTGVLASDGEGSEGIQKKMLHHERPAVGNTHPEKEYRLTLSKTNSGYTGQLNNGEEVMFFEPDLLHVQDSKVYVGFYAARLATIEVSAIDFQVTAAKTDAPKLEPPAEAVSPQVSILSLDKTSKTDYDLLVRSNVDGIVTVRQGQKVIAQDQVVQAGEVKPIKAVLNENSNTNFSLTFLPDDTQFLTSYDQMVRNFTVETRSFIEGGDMYVSPTGTSAGDGTKTNPLDLDTAIHFVREGQKIIVLEGNYVRNSLLEIRKYNDGTAEAMKYLVADPDATERPLIDFDRRSEGVVHSGNYWHVEGIDFARSAGNTKGYTISGSHNVIENVRLFEHGDTGLQISRTDTSAPREEWPSYNLVLNSISFDNRDPSENNADGFAAKLTVGEGNVFRGCVSHNNIDDGWDLYTKVGTGAIGAVTIENSIAFNNGRLTNGYEGNAGKNGFKLGGEGVHVPHVIKNSIAFGNGYFGFTSNSNPGLIAQNNIGYNNGGANLSFTTYAHIPTDFTIDGFVSYRTADVESARDSYPAELASDQNYMFNGSTSVNKSGEELSATILASLESIFETDHDGRIVSIKRNDSGEILWDDVWETFNKLIHPEPEVETIEADVEFNPQVLNLKGVQQSSAKNDSVATLYIELPDGFNAEDIDLESIHLNYALKPVKDTAEVSGRTLSMKFSRAALLTVVDEGEETSITITGQLKSGVSFEGTKLIKVIK